jgi:predicted GNAT family N-acyltransferase
MKGFIYKLVENDDELTDAFEVRRQVFVDEQGVQEDVVFDGCEGQAMHVVVKDGEKPIGTARVRFLDTRQVKLERMAVLEPFRHIGIGRKLMSFLAQELKNKQVEKVVLHAQFGAIEFYRACGFNESGSPFREAGIKHIKMVRDLG